MNGEKADSKLENRNAIPATINSNPVSFNKKFFLKSMSGGNFWGMKQQEASRGCFLVGSPCKKQGNK